MVRAILAGRKTQTRRIVRPQPYISGFSRVELAPDSHFQDMKYRQFYCPYGIIGDRTWVRECFARRINGFAYRADGNLHGITWKPSIHMPRSASRITLEITGVRLQRLKEISEEDAKAEGFDFISSAPTALTHRTAFGLFWNAINIKRASWESNPWVWAINFVRIG